TQPSGLKFLIDWQENASLGTNYFRLLSVISSAGYRIAVDYVSDAIGSGPSPNPDWFKRSTVKFSNTAISSSTQAQINYSYRTNTVDVRDPGSRTWGFTADTSGRVTGVRRPGSSSDNISYGYGTDGTVNSATRDGVTNSYTRVIGPLGRVFETATDPL